MPSIALLQFRDQRRTFGVLVRSGGAHREDVGEILGNSAALDPRLGETCMHPSFDTATHAIMAVRRPDADPRKKHA